MALMNIIRREKRYRIDAHYTTVCAWCGRVRDGERWYHPPAPPEIGSVSHGICPECLQRQLDQIIRRGR